MQKLLIHGCLSAAVAASLLAAGNIFGLNSALLCWLMIAGINQLGYRTRS